MTPLMSTKVSLLLFLVISAIFVPVLVVATQSHEDDFDEFEEVKSQKVEHTESAAKQTEEVGQATQAKDIVFIDFDDDEFEGISTTEQVEETTKPLEQAFGTGEATAAPPTNAWTQYNWVMETLSIVFVVLFAVNYVIGRSQNEKIASNFARTFKDLFAQEFSMIGTNGAILVKESQHTFRLCCTGRINCIGLQANLRLSRRQDLAARLYSMFYRATPDVLDIQIALNDDALDTIIFALTKNRDARQISNDFPDLKSYTKSYKTNEPLLPDNVWTVMGESKELFSQILSNEAKIVISNHKDLVKLIHITDLYSEHKEYKKVLHVMFNIPSGEKMEDLRLLLKMTFHLIDNIAKAKIPTALKASIEKARSKVVTEEQKEDAEKRKEELEQKKLEKRRKAMEGMNADERAAYEEKEKQRKMKKKAGAKMMVVR